MLAGRVRRDRRAFIGHLSGDRILGSIHVGIGRGGCGVSRDIIVIIGAVLEVPVWEECQRGEDDDGVLRRGMGCRDWRFVGKQTTGFFLF